MPVAGNDDKVPGAAVVRRALLVRSVHFLAARVGKLKFAELPVPLSQAEAMRIAAKSAAVWSLKANSEGHAPVATLCELEATKSGGAARLLLSRPPQ